MSTFRLEIDVDGFNAARRDPELQAELRERGVRAQLATGSPDDFEVVDSPSATRARVVVITKTAEGRRLEATDRALTKAFDAARG